MRTWVRLFTATPVRLDRQLELSTESARIRIRPFVGPDHPLSVANLEPRISVDLFVEAPSVREAMNRAPDAVGPHLIMFGLAHDAVMPRATPFVGLELPERGGPFQFLQRYLHLPLSRTASIEFAPNRLAAAISAFESCDAEYRDRLALALALLQSGDNELDGRDSYIDFWEAIEVLGIAINRKHALPTKKEGRCKECKVPYDIPLNQSVPFIVEQLVGGSSKDAKRLRDLRVDIAHGLVTKPTQHPADRLLLRQSVIAAVGDLCGLRGAEWMQSPRGHYPSHGAALEVEASVTHADFGQLDTSANPPCFRPLEMKEGANYEGFPRFEWKWTTVGFARRPAASFATFQAPITRAQTDKVLPEHERKRDAP